MKVIVTKEKESIIYGGKIFNFGNEFEADDAIARSLIERGFAEEVSAFAEGVTPSLPIADESATEHEAEIKEGYLDDTQLEDMPYHELKRLAAQMGLDSTGKKVDIIARIRGEEVGVVEEDAPTDELPNTNMPE